MSGEAFETVLDHYPISWLVDCNSVTLAELDRFSALLDETAAAADCRIFRVRNPQRSRFQEGSDRVTADVDRIDVKDATGDRVVLKYHWVPTLRTEPPLSIEEAREPGMPVGFISVRPGGLPNFTIRSRRVFDLASVARPEASDPRACFVDDDDAAVSRMGATISRRTPCSSTP
jgi:hypothetical protein